MQVVMPQGWAGPPLDAGPRLEGGLGSEGVGHHCQGSYAKCRLPSPLRGAEPVTSGIPCPCCGDGVRGQQPSSNKGVGGLVTHIWLLFAMGREMAGQGQGTSLGMVGPELPISVPKRWCRLSLAGCG